MATHSSMITTLAVMARAPVEGRCKTRLAALIGATRATALYSAMLQDTLDVLSRIPVNRHVVLAAPEDNGVERLGQMVKSPWQVVPQTGATFGERLLNGLASQWLPGHAVALIGSDSPTMPLEGEQVAQSLKKIAGTSDVLIGPSDDGGYYFIGLGRVANELFVNMPWSTEIVFSTTIERCKLHGHRVELLPTWYDVDDAADLQRLKNELSKTPSSAPKCAQILESL